MATGIRIGPFEVGQKIGQGGFGQIFIVRNVNNGLIYALKIEDLNSKRKTLEFESIIYQKLQCCSFIPRFFGFGRTLSLSWMAIELMGPSLSSILNSLSSKRFSKKCAIKVSVHVLEALQNIHENGIVHRDIKPQNVLLRHSRQHPIAIIDFGLSKVYIDETTNSHHSPKPHPGFRGTTVYASPNAHMNQDLSRRDDIISWFYLFIDILTGSLPWKSINDNSEMLHSKRRINFESLVSEYASQMQLIWENISNMSFSETPNYGKIKSILESLPINEGENDDYDWHPTLFNMDVSSTPEFSGFVDTSNTFGSETQKDTIIKCYI